MKKSTIFRIITFILLIVVIILFFTQADEGIFRIAMLFLFAISFIGQGFLRKEDKNAK